MERPSILFVGPTYALAINRLKIVAFTKDFQVTCATSDLTRKLVFDWPVSNLEAAKAEESLEVCRFAEWPSGVEYTKLLYRGLGQLFCRKQFDFVLVDNEPWGILKWQVWLLTRVTQKKALFGEFTTENVRRPGLKGAILSIIYRAAVRCDDFTISLNNACRNILLSYGARPERNLVAAQLGVDPVQFSPVDEPAKAAIRGRMGLKGGEFLVGYCGRFLPEKGLLELIAAMDQLKQSGGYEKVRLVLMGSGPLAEYLQAESRSRNWLTIMSARPPDEVPSFMQAIDLLVLASKPVNEPGRVNEEQFGHVLIEAMACKTPAIGSSCGAIPEVLGDDRAVFAHSSSSAIAEALKSLIGNRPLREEITQQQYHRVMKYYTHESVARIYTGFLFGVRQLIRDHR